MISNLTKDVRIAWHAPTLGAAVLIIPPDRGWELKIRRLCLTQKWRDFVLVFPATTPVALPVKFTSGDG
jgi:hypothetical protein